MIKLICAIDRSNAIGHTSGELAYRLPLDMQRFKTLTTGSTVLMGYKTFKSLGRKNGLPNRRNVVMTHRAYSEVRHEIGLDVDVISDWRWLQAHQEVLSGSAEDLWIIGGASIFDQAIQLGIVGQIELTLVNAANGGDVCLKTDLAAWKLFILQQQKLGTTWVPTFGTSQRDGDFDTTYITLTKVANVSN